MVDVVGDPKDSKVQKRTTSYQHTLPKDWAEICGLEEGVETEVALLYSEKHGYHLGIWKKGEQPRRGNEDD